MLSNHVLLQKAQKQRIDLETELTTVNRQDTQLSLLKGRIDIRNFDEYHRQRREFNTERIRLEREIHRFRVYEEILRDRIKEEQRAVAVA